MKSEKKEIILKKLLYQCHNLGYRETSLILTEFANSELAFFSLPDLEHFTVILSQTDANLYKWLILGHPYPSYLPTKLMNLLKNYCNNYNA